MLQMQVHVWRSIHRLGNHACPCRNLVLFHSTPVSFAKWNDKFDYEKDDPRGGQPSKNYIRYAVRRKRADAKRALNDFLLKGAYTKRSVQDEWAAWYSNTGKSPYTKAEDFSDDFYDHSQHPRRCKPSRPTSKKTKQTGKKHKKWTFVSDDEDDYREKVFEATIGDRCYTWSFRSGKDFDSQGPSAGFKWRDNSSWFKTERGPWGNSEKEHASNATNNRRAWESESDFDDDDDDVQTANIGLSSHRAILGLPPTGPLKMDDVKAAFRASALKWHPDKHQGPSQAIAGEKFKHCVEAYNSLCKALNPA